MPSKPPTSEPPTPHTANPDQVARVDAAPKPQTMGVGALSRLRKKARRVVRERVQPLLETTLVPKVQQGARAAVQKLADPAHAALLQRSLAGLAQWTMRAGFRVDADARLLFEFVDAQEEEHSREVVLEIVTHHAATYERDLLRALLHGSGGADAPRDLWSAGMWAADSKMGLNPESAAQLSQQMLELLCTLAALDDPAPPPTDARDRLAYFENAPIPARFKILGRMASGDPAAFQPADAPDKISSATPRGGLPARIFASLNDPAVRFATTGYLLFLHSYLLRAMIEALPALLETVAEAERQSAARAPDILDQE